MNLKQKCVQCHKELASGFRMILMMGPQGFRKYAVCGRCAEKVTPSPALPPRGKGASREVKADAG